MGSKETGMKNGFKTVMMVGVVIGVAACAVDAFAFVAPRAAASKSAGVRVGQRVIHPVLTESASGTNKGLPFEQTMIKQDARSGVARLVTGALIDRGGAKAILSLESLAADALAWLGEHRDLIDVAIEDLELDTQAVLIDDDVQFIRFNVRRDGLLIEDAAIDFRFKKGNLLQVANDSFSEAVSDLRPAVGGIEGAVSVATGADEISFVRELSRVTEVKSGYQLVRVAEYAVTVGEGRFLVQAEMATGNVFEMKDERFFATGSALASVHGRTYRDARTAMALPEVNLVAGQASVQTGVDGLFSLTSGQAPVLQGFAGKRVDVRSLSSELVNVQGTDARGAWRVAFQPSGTAQVHEDKEMAQAMAYVHINKMIQWAKTYMGDLAWFRTPVVVNVNLNDVCNAYWDGRTINLFSAGEGCANSALVADVMYHEWGHGLHMNAAGGIRDRAYSEGFADGVSMLQTRSSIVGPNFMLDGGSVRDMETLKVYPRDQGEEHDEGQIVGGAFWDLFKSLRTARGEAQAVELMSNYLLKTIVTTTRYTGVYDAILLVDDNDGNIANGTPNFCAINSAFVRHGLASAASQCAR
jgi:hypothetical protein